MKATFVKLERLQATARNAFYKSNRPDRFLETKAGRDFERRWELMMEQLRGWGASYYDSKGNIIPMRNEWIEYCSDKINPKYNFGDVLA